MSTIRKMFVLVLCALLACASAAFRTCNGNIDNLSPTGKSIGGVSASNQDAAYDQSDLRRYKHCFDAAADTYCIQTSVLAAIASRESRGGRIISSSRGYSSDRRGYGLMQCDVRSSGLSCTSCPWDSCCHVNMMTQFLVGYINAVKAKLGWSQDRSLQGGVAAYNFDIKNVRTWERLDVGTTDHDYSNDVIARAKYLKAHGWN